ncbi:MAG TPA: elongation factor G [Actinomycetales bacterium]|nr:elongation factor G [Actinomycetales bacterium]
MSTNTDRIRTVAVVGASDAGKTTLLEALLHKAGVIDRAGTVEAGTTVADSSPEATRRGISLTTTPVPLTWEHEGRAYALTFLDTPGHEDFSGEVDAALTVADLALVAVSALEGPTVGTRRVWRRCRELGVPRVVVVTKEDKKGADFHAVLDQLRAAFGEHVLPLDAPDADGERFTRVRGTLDSADAEFHDAVVEEIVGSGTDDEQLERYLDGEQLTAAEVERTLAAEVAASEEFPLVVTSATEEVGLGHLLDLVCAVGPSPAVRGSGVLVGGELTRVPADPGGGPLLQVFHTVADQYVGRLSQFKVLSGTVRAGDELVNTSTGHAERLGQLLRMRGAVTEHVDRLEAGEIGAVGRLEDSPTRSLLALPGRPVTLADLGVPAPVYARAVRGRARGDADRLPEALRRMTAEDPSLAVEQRADTGQLVLLGQGDVHLDVVVERLERAHGVRVEVEEVRIAYRETAAGRAEAEGRLKKQSGGHGQFAVIRLRVEPGERGSGLTFLDEIVGGAVPRQYVEAVEKGLVEAMAKGGPRGFPVVDLVVAAVDGKTHSVDSSDMAFRTAASFGLTAALESAGTQVLEPVQNLVVDCPTTAQGDVLADLGGRRGRIHGAEDDAAGHCRITATVPTAELLRYVPQLRALTGGRGTVRMAAGGYEPVAEALVRTAE